MCKIYDNENYLVPFCVYVYEIVAAYVCDMFFIP